MSFKERLIDITLTLGQGSFGDGQNRVKISGLRTRVRVDKAGGILMGTASIDVYGLPLDQMNKLTVFGPYPYMKANGPNTVVVEAGDEEDGMAIAFQRNVSSAWADFNSMPEVPFHIEAQAGFIESMQKVDPTSVNGSADVAALMSKLASKMGRNFENSGVASTVSNPYLYGSARQQAMQLARAAGIGVSLDDPLILAIWPRNGKRGGQIPLVSKDSGMVGYPSFTNLGVMVKMLYNKNITFQGQMQIESAVKPANATWTIFSISHDLESMVPDGAWFTTAEGVVLGQPLPVLN
jgi:hypothetical protein